MSLSFVASCFPRFEKMVSRVLFDAHRRTVADGSSLLQGLRPMKEGLMEIFDGEEINLTAANDDIINGLYFKGSAPKAIIFLHGNGCFYETSGQKALSWRESLKEEGSEIPHLLLFNPRGTGESKGRTQTSFVIEDFQLMFDYLCKQVGGVSHVVFAGHSMGGYFGLFGAAEVQKKFPEIKVNFISDRSLWELGSRVTSKVEAAGYQDWNASLLSYFIRNVITSPDWSRDCLKALESLKGRVLIIYHPKDGVVLYNDSTHQGLFNAIRKREYLCMKLFEEDPHAEIGPRPHNREFTDFENEMIIAEIKRMLEITPLPESSPSQIETLDSNLRV